MHDIGCYNIGCYNIGYNDIGDGAEHGAQRSQYLPKRA